ncbi:histidine phosphatase family protein [Chitinibacteraceae bacterium HSL-7]
MTRTIYLLRHGQTQFNAERRLQGHCDSPLTGLGQAQAREMGRALHAELGRHPSYHMVSSPLPRACATARLVAAELGRQEAPIPTDPRLIEVAFGAWETLQVPELHRAHPELATRPDWHFAAPGGESYRAVRERIDDFLSDDTLPACLVVVSHGLLGRIVRGVYAGMDEAALWAQDMPQDAFFRLLQGRIERIECADAALEQ